MRGDWIKQKLNKIQNHPRRKRGFFMSEKFIQPKTFRLLRPSILGIEIGALPTILNGLKCHKGEIYLSEPVILSPIPVEPVTQREIHRLVGELISPFSSFDDKNALSALTELFHSSVNLADDVKKATAADRLRLILPSNIYFQYRKGPDGKVAQDEDKICGLVDGKFCAVHAWEPPTKAEIDGHTSVDENGKVYVLRMLVGAIRPPGSPNEREFVLNSPR